MALKDKEVDSMYCPDNTKVIETKDVEEAIYDLNFLLDYEFINNENSSYEEIEGTLLFTKD